MRLATPIVLRSLTSLALVLAGCRDTPPPTGTATTTGASQPANNNQSLDPNATPQVAAPNDTAPAGGTALVSSLTDGQILEVVHEANSGEIAQAKAAQAKAKDPRVKKLAAMMISDHSDADKKATDLAKKGGLELLVSPTSTSVDSDGRHVMDELKTKTGADFDKAYVDAQVTEHQAVLDTIDGKLLPSAGDADVKSLLQTIRPKIAMHLRHAEDVQSALAK